jgi:hypothetical protein
LSHRAFRNDLGFLCHTIKCLYPSKVQPIGARRLLKTQLGCNAMAAKRHDKTRKEKLL